MSCTAHTSQLQTLYANYEQFVWACFLYNQLHISNPNCAKTHALEKVKAWVATNFELRRMYCTNFETFPSTCQQLLSTHVFYIIAQDLPHITTFHNLKLCHNPCSGKGQSMSCNQFWVTQYVFHKFWNLPLNLPATCVWKHVFFKTAQDLQKLANSATTHTLEKIAKYWFCNSWFQDPSSGGWNYWESLDESFAPFWPQESDSFWTLER